MSGSDSDSCSACERRDDSIDDRFQRALESLLAVIPVLYLTTTTSQNCEAVPRRARIQGAWTCVSLNSRLESNKEEEEEVKRSVTRSVTRAGRLEAGGRSGSELR